MKLRTLDKKASKIMKNAKKLTPFQRKARSEIRKECGE
jgi:hypothetical protein